MSQEDIQIHHEWEFRKPVSNMILTYSNSFNNNLIRGVEFTIFCGMSKTDACILVLSKKPCTPANATIELMNNNGKYEETYIDGWTNVCRQRYILDKSFDGRCLRSFPYKFKCTITWHGFKESIPDGIHVNLKNFLTSSDLSDLKIVIDQEEIPVHRIIIAAYSPVFLAMLKTDPTESTNKQIIITDIDVNVMRKVIDFMYTGVIHPNPEVHDLLSILQVADKYEIMALKTLCERKLTEKMKVENVLKILDKASSGCGVPQLIETVISFMVEHKSEIIELEEFKYLYCRKSELLLEFAVRSIAAD